jgi:GAF domain-containing protein
MTMADRAESTIELTTGLSEVARALFAAGDVSATLQAVVDLATATIDGCDYASIFVEGTEDPSRPIVTDPLVARIDELQRLSDGGPCIDAVRTGQAIYVDDLAGDTRWPAFAPQAADSGIRCLLVFPLSSTGAFGVLNLSATYPGAFGATDRAKGVIFATLAELALAGAQTHEEEDRRADNLHQALVTRELIGRAEGILIERERITSAQAFDILRRASQHLNVKLKQVAEELVETGERPRTGPPEPRGRRTPGSTEG